MNKKYSLLALIVLLLASLACQSLAGGAQADPQPQPYEEDNSQPDQSSPDTEENSGNNPGITIGGETDFPMPSETLNVVSVGGSLNFQTPMPLEEVLKFYQDYYIEAGYTERAILTVVSEDTFSIVFDGDPSGQAIIIQGVDLGDGTTNVNISLQDI